MTSPSPQSQPPASSRAPSGASRARWMDLIRGSAILLVVLLHATAIPWMFGGISSGRVVNDINSFFAPYRMSLLFLLSGVLLTRSLAKPPGTYYWNKVRTLIWPYLVWMIIGMLTEGYTDLRDPFFWIPNNWLWFIFFLAVYYAVAPLLARIPGTWFALVPAVLWIASWPLPDGDLSNLCYYGGFFFAGHLCVRLGSRLSRFETRTLMWVCLAVASGFGAFIIAGNRGYTNAMTAGFDAHRLELLPVVIAGIAGTVMAVRRLTGSHEGHSYDRARWLQYIGRNSVVFYLVHFPTQVWITNTLSELGVTNPNISLPACFFGALAVAYLACWLRRFRVVDALFVLPKFARRSTQLAPPVRPA
ncbi:fucose 4-O-acetylase-like acetyltransferase [Pseudoclavibacter sp. JAI123]|uniref:acyltransferase family protein n=1 Tax=Pseudoclavibacter sp. JAI123 TaxID=2723065 RepID=UPI0015CBB9A8|nr:acyltransferase [Pseudoclavibacter sp. JAI123]NYF12624.1 fucose 4-O-acetylase-like acetyltransferase [Pseudoclavibacter sp. JAI123]